MRSTSSNKKRGPMQISKYIQNKIFISSNHLTPLSSNIATKLDLIKQQISREIQSKRPLDKNRGTSTTKKTNSLSKIRSATITPQPTKINYDEGQFRQKYYNANEQYLKQRNNYLQLKQQYNQLKHSIIQFLQEPTLDTGKNIQRIINNQKMEKLVDKYVNLSEQFLTYQNSLIQIMNIMEVQDLQSLIQKLQKNNNKSNNLDQCTFKILELQSENNEIREQQIIKIKKLKDQYQKKIQENSKNSEKQIDYLNNRLIEYQKDLYNQKNIYQNLKNDLRQIINNWQCRDVKWNSQVAEIRDIHVILLNFNFKTRQIMKEAQENKQKFINSNQQINRLEEMFQDIKNQFMIKSEEQKNKLNQKQQYIQQIHQKIDIKQNIIKEKNELIKKNQEEFNRQKLILQSKIQQLQSYFKIISKNIFMDQNSSVTPQIITSKIIDLKQKISSNQLVISWHEKQLNAKEHVLKQFKYNIEHLMNQNKQFQNLLKNVSLERDQYKFLLTNIRQQIVQLKKDNADQKQKLIKIKQNEFINNHKDILQLNQRITNQNKILQTQIRQITAIYQQVRKNSQFTNRKIQQIQQSLKQKESNNYKLQQQNHKYKKHLNDIELAFKQVQNISIKNQQKIQKLDKQKNTIFSQYQSLKEKYNELEKQYKEKYQDMAKLKTKSIKNQNIIEDYQKKIQQLQHSNSQLRLKYIQKDTQIRNWQEQDKILKKSNKQLMTQNNQLIEKVNQLTKKILQINNHILIQKNQKNKKIKLRQIIKLYKNQLEIIKSNIKQEMNQYKSIMKSKISQIKIIYINSITQFKKQFQKQPQTEKIIAINKKVDTQIQTQQTQSIRKCQNIIQNLDGLKRQLKVIKFDCLRIANQNKQSFTSIQQIQNKKSNIKLHLIKNLIKVKLQSNSLRNQLSDVLLLLKSTKNNYFRQIEILITQQINSNTNFIVQNIPICKHRQHQIQTPQKRISDSSKLSQEITTPKLGNKFQSFGRLSSQEQENRDISIHNTDQQDIQVNNVKQILKKIKDNDCQDPKVPYYHQIKTLFEQVKQKCAKKNLNLDISAVDGKPGTISSPNSLSFCKQFVFDRRMNTQSYQQIRQTHRSQKPIGNSSAIQKINLQLRNQIKQLQESLSLLQEQYDNLMSQKLQIQKKFTILENSNSTKTLQKLFQRLIDSLINDKIIEFQQTMRIILKVLGFNQTDIQKIDDNFNKKKKKKTNNFFTGLFK